MISITKKTINSKYIALFFAFFIGVVTATTGRSDDTVSLTFGVYQSDKATVMYRKFTPVIEHIQNYMGKILDREVDISIKIFRSYEEANDAIIRGDVDFVRFGPASYITAKDRNSNIRLLAIEKRKGKTRFNGAIIVPAHSSVVSIKELKGRTFAFGDKNSTIGRYLSQGELVRAGVHGRDLDSFTYLGRHDKVFKAVALSKFDAGALKETTVSRYNKGKKVRVIHRFETVTKPWLSRGGLNEQTFKAIKASLVALKDPQILKELKVSGFAMVDDTFFAKTKEGIIFSTRFEE
jgi:phosphonate transport system substrate-binding protein